MQKKEPGKSNLRFPGLRIIRASSMIWLLTAILISSASAQETDKSKSEHAPALVRVDSGQLQGVEADGVISFKGIPFAAPPVGELRWRPPQPTPSWTGV